MQKSAAARASLATPSWSWMSWTGVSWTSDIINMGGLKVCPREIEAAVMAPAFAVVTCAQHDRLAIAEPGDTGCFRLKYGEKNVPSLYF